MLSWEPRLISTARPSKRSSKEQSRGAENPKSWLLCVRALKYPVGEAALLETQAVLIQIAGEKNWPAGSVTKTYLNSSYQAAQAP